MLIETDKYNIGILMKNDAGLKQLVLKKGEEKFIFRYQSGAEDDLLDALIDQAQNPTTTFDWFDAAVLSFKLTQLLIGQADEILNENSNADLFLETS